ncbi:MAG TPA: LysM peptidoglycan-binding domain-containing protein [Rhodanobacter sp.]|nr:LysM peptidoglycan-binding domain-containing protein [Rhodanobacter sp.]
MSDPGKRPDFSDVQSEVRSQAEDMSPASRADFSNVHSHASSTADTDTNYEVQKGDTLSRIARHFYDDANAWRRIFDANRDQLSDPDRIQPGQMLKIPAKP